MTGEVVGWAFRQKTGSPITKAVLVKLADNANDTGYCFPSVPYLVAHLELSERALREHLKKLEDSGLIKIIRRFKDGVALPSHYQLHILATFEQVTVERRGGAPDAVPPMQDVPRGGAGDAGGVMQDVQTETPSSNPQDKPQSEPPSTAVAVVEGPSEIDLAVEAFNQAAEACPKWAHCRDITHARRAAIAARLKTHGLDGWRRAVDLARASGHLGGPVPTTGTHQGWRMDIGWFAKAEHFSKIIEGGYAPAKGATNSRDAARDGILQGLEELSR